MCTAMLLLDMRVQCRVGQVVLAAATLEVTFAGVILGSAFGFLSLWFCAGFLFTLCRAFVVISVQSIVLLSITHPIKLWRPSLLYKSILSARENSEAKGRETTETDQLRQTRLHCHLFGTREKE
jgi:hypothetical protein